MIITQIISGGQTGADQGGLAAAKLLGLKTGGWMPKGWRTQTGPRPDMRELYGMTEHASPDYPPRTAANVKMADATLIFGNAGSRGCRLTQDLCVRLKRPFFLMPWYSSNKAKPNPDGFRDWLIAVPNSGLLTSACILNVSGNREESQPGIAGACCLFLVEALGKKVV